MRNVSAPIAVCLRASTTCSLGFYFQFALSPPLSVVCVTWCTVVAAAAAVAAFAFDLCAI